MTLKPYIISGALFLVGLILFFSFHQKYEHRFSSLSQEITIQRSNSERKVLLEGDVLSADFKAEYINLGKISVRFFNFHRDSNDELEFRLRTSDSDEWLYKANYNTNQFLPDEYFSFGFPVDSLSQGKSYRIEIESLRGATESGIALSKITPQAVAVSEFSKKFLLSRSDNLLYFLKNKFIDIVSDMRLLLALLVFQIPFFLYLVLYFSKKLLVFPFVAFAFLIGYFLSNDVSELSFQFIAIPAMWSIMLIWYRIEPRLGIGLSFLLILFGIINLLFNDSISTERFLEWGYVFSLSSFFTIVYYENINLRVVFTWSKLGKKVRNEVLYLLEKAKEINGYLSEDLHKSPAKILILVFIATFVLILTKNSFDNVYSLQKLYAEYYQSSSLIPFIKFNAIKLILVYLFSGVIALKVYRNLGSIVPSILLFLILISGLQLKVIGRNKELLTEPRINMISPNTIHESWTDVVIYGHNFKNLPFEGKVILGGVDQYLLISWTDKRIIFRTNPDITKTGDLYVLTSDGKKSNKVELKYTFEY